MAKNYITLEAATDKVFPLNHRSGDSRTTIQNNTSGILTVTVTNDNVQRNSSPVFAAPPSGALTIAAGAISVVEGPFVALNLNSAGAGQVSIAEEF